MTNWNYTQNFIKSWINWNKLNKHQNCIPSKPKMSEWLIIDWGITWLIASKMRMRYFSLFIYHLQEISQPQFHCVLWTGCYLHFFYSKEKCICVFLALDWVSGSSLFLALACISRLRRSEPRKHNALALLFFTTHRLFWKLWQP